ncbi:hypothetical protein PV721_22880 [Streptomyces sp. MB09-01]|uniref:hypothetical protein n=1 Tax=Streptomyces sp. MB09-01 TaxID=3028666 RepID=UPI0029A3B7F1|nr:hypothetical protein [Streptomyces sp. MB09-01]MDX3537166.1 hypothetical protein [Streptomyces sp. MB09-01]
MRTFRAVAGLVLSAALLTGCGPSASGDGDDTPPKASTESAPGPTGSAPGPGTSPGPTASPTAGRLPAPGETLVRVTRSGGFAGRTHTLIVKGDGSWTLLDAEAKQERTGTMPEAGLAALRTALEEADFAHLPRSATGGPTIYDGYFYTFVHGGYEVAGAQGSLPPALTKVVDALPSFTAR